jgi:hypothetical protein
MTLERVRSGYWFSKYSKYELFIDNSVNINSTFFYNNLTFSTMFSVLQIRTWDPVLFYFLDPGFGSGINFFGIRDELSFWLLRLDPETIRSKKKGSVYFSFLFLCRIRDEKILGSGSGIRFKNPGSATLLYPIRNSSFSVNNYINTSCYNYVYFMKNSCP